MAMVSFKSLATISRETWTPSKSVDGSVWHYSIPNFDTGMAHLENTSSIMSNKFLITKPCVLISKLNPKSPRVWLIENVQEETSVCSTEFIVLTPNSPADLRFLYFLLKSSEVRQRLSDIATGTSSSHQRVRPEDILNLEVECLDSVIERQNCSNVLMALESRISLNVEIAKTLEEIAQTIFKSWFVDFDPVKAKMAEEKPVGMDDATAALFPDRMEDSELSPIPKGWELSQIGDEVECVGGSTPSTSNSEFWDGDICWTTPKDLSKQIGLITTTSERRITSKGLEKISSGVLPVNSVLMSSRAPIGYLSINAVPSAINQGFIALRQNPKFAPLYLLFWLQTNMAEIKNRAGGGTFAEISKTAFKSIPFVVPDEGILKKYEEISEPILLQLAALTLQNQELIELRDSLLPRLITGELQIPEEMLVS